MHALFSAQICQLLGRNLSLLAQVAFISHDDDWNIADLRQLLDPFAYTDERIGIREVEDHQTGIKTLDIGADYVCVSLLPRRIPNLHLGHRVPVDAYVHSFGVCAVCLDLFDAQSGCRIDILQNETGFSHVKVAQDCNLNG